MEKDKTDMFEHMEKTFKSLASTNSATPARVEIIGFSNNSGHLHHRSQRNVRTNGNSSSTQKSAQSHIPIPAAFITPDFKDAFWGKVNSPPPTACREPFTHVQKEVL